MRKYSLSKKAVADLSTIWNYTFEVWSESQADQYYFMILDCCPQIADKKIDGRKYPDISDALYGTKVGQHIVFFRKDSKNKIKVIRILHNRMDLKLHLKE